eukprot:PRCOL_00006061-RA
MGNGDDVVLRRGDAFPADAPAGPIFVCTRNDALDGIIESVPEGRREDLVFLQNGMLQPYLDAKGLGDNTQALIYMAVAKLGDAPTDGITDTDPDGLTAACGKWAPALAARLNAGGMSCHVLEGDVFKASMLEKLIWISAFMLVGARHPGATVGDVESQHTDEVTQLIDELAAGCAAQGVTFKPDVAVRLRAYARSVAHFPTAVKELEWRNGYFHSLTKKAVADGEADPFPTHTAWLTEVGAVPPLPKFALLFDCDGVIVETEELHRLAYNASFKHFELKLDGTEQVEWTVEYYDVLQNTVGGGKPKMKYYFNTERAQWPSSVEGAAPESEEDRSALVDRLQDQKTVCYKELVETTAEARPGVLRLMDEALDRGDVAVAICSAATRAGFDKVVNSIVKPDRLARFDVILAGDDVSKKKPDPLIYNLARERLGVPRERCVVVEDSIVGLKAAVSAGMPCIITPTSSNSTSPEEFLAQGAALVVEDLDTCDMTAAGMFPADADVPKLEAGTNVAA